MVNLFDVKKCKSCGEKIKKEWEFCPFCGEETSGQEFPNIFNDIEDEFKRIDKTFASDFFQVPKFDMRMPKGGNGISIVISSGTGGEPKIQVRTSGGYKNLEPEIKKNLGIRPVIGVKRPVKTTSMVTEEPEADIKSSGNKQLIQIKLPEIKNPKDIEIKKLEQSIEIKAFSKDKIYFKLLPISSSSEIVNKEFSNGTLKIELEK